MIAFIKMRYPSFTSLKYRVFWDMYLIIKKKPTHKVLVFFYIPPIISDAPPMSVEFGSLDGVDGDGFRGAGAGFDGVV